MSDNKVIHIDPDSEAGRFLKRAIESKREIKRQLRAGKKFSEIKGKNINFVNPLPPRKITL